MRRRVYDQESHVHFVTFSCYKRRALLQHAQARQMVIGQLGRRLAKAQGTCTGFVIMPDHVHALIWLAEPGQLGAFMNKWKDQSSHAVKQLYQARFPNYWEQIDHADAVWQPRYYDFNIWSRAKLEEKLEYMHLNPVRAGLVERAIDWPWSSARWYLAGRSVGLPVRWPPGMEAADDFVVGA